MSCYQADGIFILPIELRDTVYDHVILRNQFHMMAGDDSENDRRSHFKSFLALAHTGRELRHDVISYMSRRKDWVFWGRDATSICTKLPLKVASTVRLASYHTLNVWIEEDELHAHQCQVEGLCALLETCAQLMRVNVEVAHAGRRSHHGKAVLRVFETASMHASSVKLVILWHRDVEGDGEDGVNASGSTVQLHGDVVLDKLRAIATPRNILIT